MADAPSTPFRLRKIGKPQWLHTKGTFGTAPRVLEDGSGIGSPAGAVAASGKDTAGSGVGGKPPLSRSSSGKGVDHEQKLDRLRKFLKKNPIGYESGGSGGGDEEGDLGQLLSPRSGPFSAKSEFRLFQSGDRISRLPMAHPTATSLSPPALTPASEHLRSIVEAAEAAAARETARILIRKSMSDAVRTPPLPTLVPPLTASAASAAAPSSPSFKRRETRFEHDAAHSEGGRAVTRAVVRAQHTPFSDEPQEGGEHEEQAEADTAAEAAAAVTAPHIVRDFADAAVDFSHFPNRPLPLVYPEPRPRSLTDRRRKITEIGRRPHGDDNEDGDIDDDDDDNDGGGEMEVLALNEDALELLRHIKVPVAVVAVAGLYRTGKSSLLNWLCDVPPVSLDDEEREKNHDDAGDDRYVKRNEVDDKDGIATSKEDGPEEGGKRSDGGNSGSSRLPSAVGVDHEQTNILERYPMVKNSDSLMKIRIANDGYVSVDILWCVEGAEDSHRSPVASLAVDEAVCLEVFPGHRFALRRVQRRGQGLKAEAASLLGEFRVLRRYDTYRFAYSLESPDPNVDEPVAMSSSLPSPFKKAKKALLAESAGTQPQPLQRQSTDQDQEQDDAPAAEVTGPGVAKGGTRGGGEGLEEVGGFGSGGGGSGFQVGATVQRCTRGIWLWGRPKAVTLENGQLGALLVLDTEGLGGLESEAQYDARIFALSTLLCSTLVYNSLGTIDETAISNLSFVAQLTHNIRLRDNKASKNPLLTSPLLSPSSRSSPSSKSSRSSAASHFRHGYSNAAGRGHDERSFHHSNEGEYEESGDDSSEEHSTAVLEESHDSNEHGEAFHGKEEKEEEEEEEDNDEHDHKDKDDEEEDIAAQLHNFLPSFVWVLRDFALELTDECGDAMSTDEYLASSLAPAPGSDAPTQERNRIRRALTAFFSTRRAVTLVRPLLDERKLQRVDAVPFDELRPEFRRDFQALKKVLFASLRPKTIGSSHAPGGGGHVVAGGAAQKPLTGPMYAMLISEYVRAVNDQGGGGMPVIETAWERVNAGECAAAATAALDAYEMALAALPLPADTVEAQAAHTRAFADALQGFDARAMGSALSVAARGQLQSNLAHHFATWSSANRRASSRHCVALLERLYVASSLHTVETADLSAIATAVASAATAASKGKTSKPGISDVHIAALGKGGASNSASGNSSSGKSGKNSCSSRSIGSNSSSSSDGGGGDKGVGRDDELLALLADPSKGAAALEQAWERLIHEYRNGPLPQISPNSGNTSSSPGGGSVRFVMGPVPRGAGPGVASNSNTARGPCADAELARFSAVKWPRLVAKAFAAAGVVKESELAKMEAAVAVARRQQARAVAEADSRAAIFESQSDEMHALRIKATRLTAQVEVLQRREEELLQKSRESQSDNSTRQLEDEERAEEVEKLNEDLVRAAADNTRLEAETKRLEQSLKTVMSNKQTKTPSPDPASVATPPPQGCCLIQ